MKAPSYFQKVAPRGAAPTIAAAPRLQPIAPLFRPSPTPAAFVESHEERVVAARPAKGRTVLPSPSVTAPSAALQPRRPAPVDAAAAPLSVPARSTVAPDRGHPGPLPAPVRAEPPIAPIDRLAQLSSRPTEPPPRAAPAPAPAANQQRPPTVAQATAEGAGARVTPLVPPAPSSSAAPPSRTEMAIERAGVVARAAADRAEDAVKRAALEPRREPDSPALTPPPVINATAPARITIPVIAPEPPAPRPPPSPAAAVRRPPSVHIGTLEVRVVAPAPLSAPAAAPRPAVRPGPGRAAPQSQRLGRGFGVFGLGQS